MTDPTPEQAPENPEVDPDDEQQPEGADELRDAGKKALDTMKSERNAARKESRELKARLDEIERLQQNQSKSPDEQAIEAARREAAAEATQAATARIVRTEIKAAAAGRLHDPADALSYLSVDDFDVDDNGDIDAEQIKDAIQDLLTKKPYLAAKRFQGDGDMGKGGQKAPPAKPTQNDLLRAARGSN